ncbi:septum site-determining protein Ssd [Gordonia sp. CPCC 206044]|uniref:septum site-determining protein Ssd n=1 Tax=Gordonia sp. CPCC 206044 TaxID=3140793 RepID=UPI003AF3B2CB
MTDELLALVGPGRHDDVARCAAAAGYRLVTAEPARCRREWLRSDAVAVDLHALELLRDLRPPRRDGVVVITDAEPPTAIWRSAVDLGAEHVVALPDDEARLVGILTDFRAPQRNPAGAVAVVGGHGGAGATTLAAAVALECADRAGRVLLLDVDEFGAGIDLALGIENTGGLRWQDLTLEGGAVRGDTLHSALPHVHDRLSVLAPRRDGARRIGVDAVLATMDAGRVHGDIVVVDLPRATGAVADAVLDSVDLVVIVTTATVSGVAASRTVHTWVSGHAATGGVAVRGPAPSGLRCTEIAAAVGAPLIVGYRSDPGLPTRMDSGRLPMSARSGLRRAARAVGRRLGDGPGRVG